MDRQDVDGLFSTMRRSFVDMSMNVDINPVTEDVVVSKDERAVTQAIKNLVLTKYGERLMQPLIGCNIHSMLFEPLDIFSALEMKTIIINTIRNYEPRVQILNVAVDAIEDTENSIAVSLTFRIIGEPKIIDQQFILERPTA
jgi:phage baseplate assembly protein W